MYTTYRIDRVAQIPERLHKGRRISSSTSSRCRRRLCVFTRSLTGSLTRLLARSLVRLVPRCGTRLSLGVVTSFGRGADGRTDVGRSRTSYLRDCEYHKAVNTTRSQAVGAARRSHDERRNARVERTNHTAMLKAALLTYIRIMWRYT